MGKFSTALRRFPDHVFGMFLCGAALAMPSAVLDVLLQQWGWSPKDFGFGVLVQGLGALGGSVLVSRWSRGTDPESATTLWTVLAALLGGMGLLLLYFGNTPSPAFACVGFAIGVLTTQGNREAARCEDAAWQLSILNMMFTAGAVVCPGLLALTLAHAPASTGGYPTWQLVPLLMALLFCARALMLAWRIRPKAQGVESAPPDTLQHAPSDINTTVQHGLWLTVCAGLALFCYVATEINLSNGWMLFLMEHAQVDQALARFAGPIFWSGLLCARILASVFPIHGRHLVTLLRVMAALSLVVLVTTLTLAHHGLPLGWAATDLRAHTFLVLVAASGLSLGSVYGFVLGAAASASPTHALAARTVGRIIPWGIVGAMVMPPLMGTVSEALGFGAGMLFIAATQSVFLLALLFWPRSLRRQ